MKKIFNKDNYILYIFILIVFLSTFFFKYGSDYFWHERIGKYIIDNKTIPFTDIFSWYGSINNLHWISHEWLFEVIIHLFNIIFTNYGPFIYTSICMLIISILILRLNIKSFKNNKIQTLIWAVIGLACFCGKILPRPHLLSYILFIITLLIIKRIINNENTKSYLFIPFTTIIWSNVHGGSSNLGYILFIIILFLYFIKQITLTKKQRNKIIISLLISILFIILNPHGIEMLIYPYKNMTYTKMINCIDEWQKLNILSVDGITYLLFIIFIIYYLFKNRKEKIIKDLVLTLPFIILAIKSTKFIPYLYIVSSYTIPSHFKKTKYYIDEKIIIIFLIICSFILGKELKLNDKIINNEMINYLKNDNIILYNSYNLGGYLIYKDIKPFVDGRADLYVNSILCDVCDIEKNNKYELLDKYDFNTFIIENNTYIEHYLKTNNNYTLKMKDKNNSIYIKEEE